MLALVFFAAVAGADEPTLGERAAAIERASQEPDGVRTVVGHLSRALGVSVDTLRTQRAETGLNWGELLIATRLARATELPLAQIVSELKTGKTWEDIAEAHGVDGARLARQVEQSQAVVETHGEDKAPHITIDQSRPPPGRGAGTGRSRR